MATRRQQNWLGQQRVDVSDLRSIESGVAADFDILAGRMMAGRQPLVLRGFTIGTTDVAGSPADQLQLSVASGLILHFGASEAGTLFMVQDDASAELLAATNVKVHGGFIANSINYVGVDLIRSEDPSSADLKQFLNADTEEEIPKTIPTARTLDYEIVISTQPFSVTPNVCPIAKVETNTTNNVIAITDCRNLMFRLGTGGDTPEELNTFLWADSARRENIQTFEPPTSSDDPFAGGDKEISSLKQWMDAIMTRVWELGSGEFWYRPNTRDSIKLVCGQPVISATQDNFQWNSGTNTLTWQSLYLVFENSTVYYNTIANGSAVLNANGQCLYVDIQRGSNASSLVPAVATLTSLGTPNIPGSRFIIAWRQGNLIHVRDRGFEVGRSHVVATTTVLGIVKLSRAATTPLAPIVLADSERNAANGVAGLDGSQIVLGTGLSRGTAFTSGALSVGTGTNDNSVSIGKSATTTTVNGALRIKDSLDTSTGTTMTIGGTTQTQLGIGRASASTSIYGSTLEMDATNDIVLGTSDAQIVGIGNGASATSMFGNTLSADATSTVNVGTGNATAVNVGRSGATTTVTGSTLTASSTSGATNVGTASGSTQVNLARDGVNTRVHDTLTVDSNTTIGGTLGVTGNVTISSNIGLTGGNPAATSGFSNTITPMHFSKAWACVEVVAGVPTIRAGVNLDSVTAVTSGGASALRIAFQNDLASVWYAAVATAFTAGISGLTAAIAAQATTHVDIRITNYSGTVVDIGNVGTNTVVNVVVFGAQ